MGKADLHIHTAEGDGLDSIDEILDHVERTQGIDVIAITEHDDLSVGLRAREVAAKRALRAQVLPGVEITTLEGHLVGLFLERPVPSLRRVEETVEAVRRQGGFCFVPHPMSWLTRSIGPSTLDRLSEAGLLPDALELANCGPAARICMTKARRLNAERYRLAAVGASDSHFRESIGSAYTEFDGRSAEDLGRALRRGAVKAVELGYPKLKGHRRLRAMALPVAGLRATPKKLGWRRTAWSFIHRYVS